MAKYLAGTRGQSRVSLFSCALWTVTACMVTLLFVSLPTHAAAVVVDPPMPLLNVPFNVTADFMQAGKNLFLSSASSCEESKMVGSFCTLPASRTCEFTVPPASVGVSAEYDKEVPLLYVCSSAVPAKCIQTLQVHVIDSVPRYVFTGVPSTLALGNATPVGSVIGFFVDSDCSSPFLDMLAVKLGEDRRLTLTVSSSRIMHFCARIPQGPTGELSAFLQAATVVAFAPFSASGPGAVRYTTSTFVLSEFNQIPFASFSRSVLCDPLLQEPVSNGMLQRVTLFVYVPRGEYYLCTGVPYYMSTRVFMPSSSLIQIKEYGLQPHTMYTALPTNVTLALDAASMQHDTGTTIALFRSPDCRQDNVLPWRPSREWTVTDPGLYYACIRATGQKGKVNVLAANVTVMTRPTTASSPSPAVRGVDTVVTLGNRAASIPGAIVVGLSMTWDCSQLVSRATTTETGDKVTLRVPENALQTMSLCVSTPFSSKPLPPGEAPDRGYAYLLDKITTRPYALKYAALFAGKAGIVTFDPGVQFEAGAKGVFAMDACTKAVGVEFAMNETYAKRVVLPYAGKYSLCVKVPRDASFTPLASVVVYGAVALTPTSILADATTDVLVSQVPPVAPVRIVAAADCSAVPVAEGTASGSGTSELRVWYATATNLTVCVGYHGNDIGGDWNVIPVGILPVTSVSLLPKTVIVNKQNRVNFVVPDGAALAGFRVVAVRGAGASCASAPSGPTLPVTVPKHGRAFVLFTPPEVTVWTLCVGNSLGAFSPAGGVSSVEPLAMTTNPSPGAAGLPVTMKFDGASWQALNPTRFAVTDTEDSCAFASEDKVPPTYGEGSIDAASRVSSSFLTTQTGTLTVCVGWEDEAGSFFVYGSTIKLVTFTSLSRYVIRNSPNNVSAYPIIDGCSLFLVHCATEDMCGAPISSTVCLHATRRYHTSSLVPLQGAPLGQYVLCQEDVHQHEVAASPVLVTAVDPFAVTLVDTEVRQYRAADVAVSGGDTRTRTDSITLFTMPPGVSCGATDARREDTTLPAGVFNGTITVTKLTPIVEEVQLCVAASPTDAFLATTFTLLPYMTPATMLTGRTVHVRSGVWKENVVAKLTAAADCAGSVMSVKPALVADYVSELRVDGCAGGNLDRTSVHYCESRDGGSVYEHRGVMPLIRLQSCDRDHPAAILPIKVPPARPIENYGIDTALLVGPVLSKTSDCRDLLPGARGYSPRFDETATFFVCARPKGDRQFVFTSDTPTLEVENFKASPTSIPSELFDGVGGKLPVLLRLNFRTATKETYLSRSASCGSLLAAAAGLADEPPRACLELTGVSGVKYVCVANPDGGPPQLPVAELLVVNPPVSSLLDPILVIGAPFRVTLRVATESGQPRLYSLVPGGDAKSVFAPFYASFFRGIFLSSDACRSVATGSALTYVGSTGRAALPTADISGGPPSLSVCAGTPAGNLSAVKDIPISTVIIYPAQFVVGADIDVYVPLTPNGVFHLRRDPSCGGPEVVPSFTTNTEAHGVVHFRRSADDSLPAIGQWTLCLETHPAPKGNSSVLPALRLQPLTTIEAVKPVHYDVRGRDVVLWVDSPFYLLNDLWIPNLLPGFSTDRGCREQATRYGSWKAAKDPKGRGLRRIVVYAYEPAGPLYLCAAVPVNNTVAAVPYTGAIRFLPPKFSLPVTVSRCAAWHLSSCALPDVSPPGAFMTVIKGDCCRLIDRLNTVGSLTRDSDNTCRLQLDAALVKDYPSNEEFSVCALHAGDASYCTTLGTVQASNEGCFEGTTTTGTTLSTSMLIAIIVLCVIFGLLLLVLLLCLLLRCRNREQDKERDTYLAYPQLHGSETNPLTICTSSTSPPRAPKESLFLATRGSHSFGVSQNNFAGSSATDTILLQAAAAAATATGAREVTRRSMLEGLEEGERDQVRLEEARDRYNLRLACAEEQERVRVAAKEQEFNFEYSGNWTNPFAASGGGDDLAEGPAPSAPKPEELDTFTDTEDGPEPGPRDGYLTSVVELAPALAPFQHDPYLPVDPTTNSMGYTTTQRFHEEWRFLFEAEGVRRQRIFNYAEEEWQNLIDAEFSDYAYLQQAVSEKPLPPPPPPPPPPLPLATVLPFAMLIGQQQDAENKTHVRSDLNCIDDVDDVYDAPSHPAPMRKPEKKGSVKNVGDDRVNTAPATLAGRGARVSTAGEDELLSGGERLRCIGALRRKDN
ncbi:uncharacterized protein Tco025E_04713 [Trypanosoma conorhini]|uniref:Uncharacterized protein n=1 Tax=Trypanosoma conorhini TaxID=83891 RepID=A0A3R7L216_9TRYP|nr:uncharacterized protein Tco025E_04713 [Trypanosoma conorhini]RNF18075.1 hypothetical protein Tco025E_04713 [Trypanosoma conorhini]